METNHKKGGKEGEKEGGRKGEKEKREEEKKREGSVCVCFWPPVPKWGSVKHEIPISSPPLNDIPSIP